MQLRYRKGWSHHQPVLPDTYTSDSRSLHQRFQKSRLNNFDSLIERLVTDGASAEPVIFGAYRRREAVMVSAEWYEERLPIIEQLLTKR